MLTFFYYSNKNVKQMSWESHEFEFNKNNSNAITSTIFLQ